MDVQHNFSREQTDPTLASGLWERSSKLVKTLDRLFFVHINLEEDHLKAFNSGEMGNVREDVPHPGKAFQEMWNLKLYKGHKASLQTSGHPFNNDNDSPLLYMKYMICAVLY